MDCVVVTEKQMASLWLMVVTYTLQYINVPAVYYILYDAPCCRGFGSVHLAKSIFLLYYFYESDDEVLKQFHIPQTPSL